MEDEDKSIAIIDSYIVEGKEIASANRATTELASAILIGLVAMVTAIFIYSVSTETLSDVSIMLEGGAAMLLLSALILFGYVRNSAINLALMSYINELSLLKRNILRGKSPSNVGDVDSKCENIRAKYYQILKRIETLRGIIEYALVRLHMRNRVESKR